MIAPSSEPSPDVEEVDVLVIGAGPAGSMAALAAARSGAGGGLNVLIVDKARFPRHKVCGCCLSAAAIKLLHDAGLSDDLAALRGIELDRLDLRAGERRCELQFPGASGLAVSRAALDQMLVDAAVRAGARFIDNCKARLTAVDVDGRRGRRVELGWNGKVVTCRARVVIAADGLRSASTGTHTPTVPDSRIGLSALLTQVPPGWEDRAIVMCCCAHGYCGMVRLNPAHLDVAAAIDPVWLKAHGGAHQAVAGVLESCGVPIPAGLAAARFTGTPLLTRRALDVAEERLLLVGDAAGYIEPFTGEGIAWALASGMAAGRLVADTLRRGDWRPEGHAEHQWRMQHRRLLGARQRRCRAIALLLRRPRLISIGTRILRRVPGVAAPIIRRIHAPFPLDLHRQTT